MSFMILCGTLVLASTEGGIAVDTARYAETVRQEPGLVAYWRMNGSLVDELSGATADVEARFTDGPGGDRALALDGTAPVVLQETPALDTPESTVSFLFRLTGPGTGNPGLVAKRSNEKTRFSLHVAGDRRGIALWNGSGVRWSVLPEGLRIEDGRWYHLAAVSGGPEGFALFLDGAPCLVNGFGRFNQLEKDLPLVLGAATPGNMEGASCELDELAFFDRALSPEAVATHTDALGLRARREALAPAFAAIRAEHERTLREAGAVRDRLRGEMLAAPDLFDRGEPRVYRGQHLEAISMPVGGIGAGLIQMDGRAVPHIWQIHNNHAGLRVPESFLAIGVRRGGETVTRALQTEAASGLDPMASLSFEARYPFGWYRFQDEALPVEVALEVFNPLIPLNARDSAIPCAIYTVTVSNPGTQAVDVCLLGSQQNTVGLDPAASLEERANPGYGGNINTCVHTTELTALHMTQPGEVPAGEQKADEFCPGGACVPAESHPSMTLVLLDASGVAAVAWDGDDLRGLLEPGAAQRGPCASEPSAKGATHSGAVSCSFRIEPGETVARTFILTWYLPEEEGGRWLGQGLMYTNWWRNSFEVARDVAARLDDLSSETRRYVNALYDTNLPYWMLDRVASQVAILRTKTCYWSRDGYFGGWEGCSTGSGCCAGNCGHVWHYAQAHARLFPELARRMREEALSHDTEGGLLFRQTADWKMVAIDGQCGEILGAWREYLCGTDAAWLRGQWPRVKRAMDYTIDRWDPDGDGMLHGPLHNTLDIDSTGTGSWWGSLYLAALQAAAEMAGVVGEDLAAERYRAVWEAGRKNQDQALWNGDYYAQVVDEQPLFDYMNGCSIDLALGEWWAAQAGLPTAYPEDRVRASLRALFQNNFQPNFHGIQQTPRKFVSDPDAGMQMITWPRGDRPTPHTLYADEVMSGFEYAAAAAMVQYGLLREGFTVVKAIADRYDGRIRRDVTASDVSSWGYTGNPFGDDECGKFYARALSSWSLLTAAQGFDYDGPSARIAFRPVWRPEDHASFFTAAQGYGLYRQSKAADTQTCTIEVRSGKVEVAEFTVQTPAGRTVAGVTTNLGDRELPADWSREGDDCVVRLPAPLVLQPGAPLSVHVRLGG